MKKVLDDLWYSYLIEGVLQRNDKEKVLIKNLSEKDNNLREKLNKEENALLEEYDRAVGALSSTSEKHAFIKGVKFTVRFLFEAFCDD